MIDLLDKDIILPFSFEKANIRGKIVRLSETSRALLERFSSGVDSVDKVFLDTIALSQIIASNFKFDGTFKLQLNSYDGIIKVVLCDNKKDGNMRAFMSLNDKQSVKNENPSFKEIVGQDSAMIFHMTMEGSSQPYQAIVDLSGEDLSSCAENWFAMSEQIQTYIKIYSDPKTKVTSALFFQKIANQYASDEQKESDNEVFNTFKILANAMTMQEMLNDNLSDILYNLYHEFDVLIFDKIPVTYKCTCSNSVIEKVIITMSDQEQSSLRVENDGHIKVTCSFCGREYLF